MQLRKPGEEDILNGTGCGTEREEIKTNRYTEQEIDFSIETANLSCADNVQDRNLRKSGGYIEEEASEE